MKLLQKKTIACAAAVLCTMLWGTAFPFIKLGYRAFGVEEGDLGASLLFAGLRFSLAGVLLLLFSTVKNRRFSLPEQGSLTAVLLLGGVQTFGQYLFTYIGIGYTTGANTSVITACASFLTVLGAAVFFRNERLTVLKIAGCALGFGGVLIMNGTGGFALQTLLGDILIFVSTVFAAGGNIIAKKVAAGRDPVNITAWQLLFGGAGLSVLGGALGGRLSLHNGQGLLILLWLALVSAVAFSLWTALLKLHPAGRISVFNLLVPVFGTLLSGVLLGENVFRAVLLLSLLMIASGIVLVNWEKRSQEKSDENIG